MTSGRFLFSLVVSALCVAGAQIANAAIIITTNMGGADAEVRESEVNPDLGGVPQGANRGTNQELATRRATNRSSAMFMKFDISGLTPADLAGKNVNLQLSVRNNNLPLNRLWISNPRQVMNFAVHGLDPNMVDGLANGNNHNANQVYDWDENTLTWYNAPGITPDDPDGTGGGQILGEYNWNSDAPLLGSYSWPLPRPENHLAVGQKITYGDANGNLKQLVLDAMTAGKTSVTLMVNHNVAVADSPGSWQNFNYLVIPKDMTTLNNDNNWDDDGAGPNPATGSPYSCLHSTVCPGGTLGDNTGGAFSPRLVIWVPEPSSIVLLALGSLAALGWIGRRRK